MKTYASGSPGFTLIELMIVVAIIAIIAAIAIPSLLRSRMTANEISAIASCKAFVEAEHIYRRSDYDRDGVLEYSQRLKGNDSLLEVVAGSGDLALIDSVFAGAEGGISATAKAGYVFTVLTSQGVAGEGGARSFLTANPVGGAMSMTLGHAICAIPAAYDGTGRNTFMTSAAGVVYLKDRDVLSATHELIYNPDSLWTPSE